MGSIELEPPAISGVLETALYASDLTAAKRFYGEQLGFEMILEEQDTFVFFRCGTTILLIFDPEQTKKQPLPPPSRPIPGHGTEGAGHLCFSAPGEMLDKWISHLKLQGIAIETEIVWDNGARSVYFRDPAGNSIEFAQPKLWGYPHEGRTP